MLAQVVTYRAWIVDDKRASVLENLDHAQETRAVGVKPFHLIDPDEVEVFEQYRIDKAPRVDVKHAAELPPVQIVPVDEVHIVAQRFKAGCVLEAVMLINPVGDRETARARGLCLSLI